MLTGLIEQGVEAIFCGTCINARGLIGKDMVEDVKIGTIMHLAQWVKENQKVLPF